jgi:glutathione S-transferase
MDYKKPAQAQALPGLRIALTVGLPAPWSMAARFMFDIKQIPYIPVEQLPGQPNEELLAWTGHRNAPVVVLNDEPPRTNWADIIDLAERINPEPRLVPEDSEDRIRMFGLSNEICGAGGLTWTARHMMLAPGLKSGNEAVVASSRTMANAYGFSDSAAAAAPRRVAGILRILESQLQQQEARGSRYFIGAGLTALDLIWASFSNTLRPLPEAVNPMSAGMRKVYQGMGDAFQPPEILFTQRDFIYEKHIGLPLDF